MSPSIGNGPGMKIFVPDPRAAFPEKARFYQSSPSLDGLFGNINFLSHWCRLIFIQVSYFHEIKQKLQNRFILQVSCLNPAETTGILHREEEWPKACGKSTKVLSGKSGPGRIIFRVLQEFYFLGRIRFWKTFCGPEFYFLSCLKKNLFLCKNIFCVCKRQFIHFLFHFTLFSSLF